MGFHDGECELAVVGSLDYADRSDDGMAPDIGTRNARVVGLHATIAPASPPA